MTPPTPRYPGSPTPECSLLWQQRFLQGDHMRLEGRPGYRVGPKLAVGAGEAPELKRREAAGRASHLLWAPHASPPWGCRAVQGHCWPSSPPGVTRHGNHGNLSFLIRTSHPQVSLPEPQSGNWDQAAYNSPVPLAQWWRLRQPRRPQQTRTVRYWRSRWL